MKKISKITLPTLFLCLMLFPLLAFAQEVFHNCTMEGDAKRQSVKELNLLKNRYQAPKLEDIDSSVTLEAILAPGDDEERWDDSKAAEIVGYVFDVKVGGVETVNCHAKDPTYRDTHIELIFDPDQSEATKRVIVEVTPRWREMMKEKEIDWSTKNLKKTLKGKWVKVRGWLLFDEEHQNQAENTDPDGDRNWRATAWEIHPVTAMEAVPNLNK